MNDVLSVHKTVYFQCLHGALHFVHENIVQCGRTCDKCSESGALHFLSFRFIFCLPFSQGTKSSFHVNLFSFAHSLCHNLMGFCWHYFPIRYRIFDIDWLTSCVLDCRTHGMMDALIKIRIIISFGLEGEISSFSLRQLDAISRNRVFVCVCKYINFGKSLWSMAIQHCCQL